MKAGTLRTKCTFQKRSLTPDGGGGGALAWGDNIVTFCEYRGQSGKEGLDAGRVESVVKATLKARWKSVVNVESGWRVLLHGDSTPWNVVSKIPMGQRNQMADIVIERGAAV